MESTAESTIANVESLITLPRGCGEQNMMLMAPTLYALEYLKQKNSRNTTVMEKAYRYIQQGEGSFNALLISLKRILQCFIHSPRFA